MSELITKYVYPLTKNFILGSEKQSFELIIQPDLPILVGKVRCRVPASGMFIIKDSPYFYEHDPYMVNHLPIKHRKLIVSFQQPIHLEITHTGFIPRGYMYGMEYLFQYSFIGTRYEGSLRTDDFGFNASRT